MVFVICWLLHKSNEVNLIMFFEIYVVQLLAVQFVLTVLLLLILFSRVFSQFSIVLSTDFHGWEEFKFPQRRVRL